jgi:hypothetical protein
LTVLVDTVYTETMGSHMDVIFEGFADEMGDLEQLTSGMDDGQLRELGRRLARLSVAPLLWSKAVGERWDVRRVTEFLDVSRQAVYKRVSTGSLLGLRGEGTTWFPVWQFDAENRIVRPVVARLIEAFQRMDDHVDPLVIASWAATASPSLDGEVPAELVVKGGQDERVVAAAARAARGLAA